MQNIELKPRSDDRLSNLPPEDLERLTEWFESHTLAKVKHLAALPRPEGLELTTSISALGRFKNKLKQERLLQNRIETLALAESVSNQNPGPTPPLRPVLLQTIEERSLGELLDPDVPLSAQTHIASLILRLAKLRDAEHTRLLDEKKHHVRERRAAVHEQELHLRLQYQMLAQEHQRVESQRHELELLKTLRDHFPMISKINWESETKDAHSLERLKKLFGFNRPTSV